MKKILLLIAVFICYSHSFSQTEQKVFLNTGKMYVGVNTPTGRCALYIDRSAAFSGQSLIRQNGLTVLKGNFYNNVTSGNVFSTGADTGTGTFEFKGGKVQYIKGTADKALNYIHFPELRINNETVVNDENQDTVAVVVAPNIGMSTQDLSLYRGRLILDSEAIMNGTTDMRSSTVTHLLVHGDVTYDMGLGSYDPSTDNKNDRGIIQVKMAIGDHYKHGYLIGFTPPFQKMYNDYFFYNFISKPTNKGLFGDQESLITDPKFGLESGKGYIVGFGVVPEGDPYYQEHWSSQWSGTVYNDRFKDMMSFARNFAPYNLSRFVGDDTAIADRYSGEKINTQDVPILLEEGWNYVGNPFTVPINMSTFLDEVATADQWGVTRGSDVARDVENRLYILTQGFGTYFPDHSYHPFRFDVTYLVAQKVGGTITLNGNPYDGLLAPMQLFVVKKNTTGNKNLIIPGNVRTHGDTKYLRSGEENIQPVKDEILIETRDMETNGYDRLCVVFREEANTASGDLYDAVKIFNSSGGVNQIYTMSLDNKQMTTNVVPLETESLVMYFAPAQQEQQVTLGAYRLSSLSAVETVRLEDTKSRTEINLLETPTYSFSSSPTDRHDRFVLHFEMREGEGIGNTENDGDINLNVYYSAGLIHIRGLRDEHTGSSVSVYALNGQLMCEKNIKETPTEQFRADLPQGTYLVRIFAKDSVIAKKLLVR